MPAAMRSMWKGVIQFGLVTVPVKLYLGVDPHSSGAHLLHEDCRSRIQQRTWCPTCDRALSRADTVRGFEVAPDRWVAVSDEEFGTLPVKTLHTIDVAQFVAAPEASRLEAFSRQPYYLAPEALGRRAFALLCATLEDTGLAAIAKIAIRDREHIATIRLLGDGLLLTTLAWPQEVRPIAQLDLPAHSDVPPAELQLARDLVTAMARPFDADEYRDDYAEALGRLVESKVAGAAFAQPSEAPSAAMVDLMAALEASVAAAVEARGTPAPTQVRAPARVRRRRNATPATAA